MTKSIGTPSARGVSRFGYDRAGRLSFSQDTWYGTRRFKYNVAGELTETVNGVGGRTRFDYDVRGRLVRITDPLDGVTTRTYTATDFPFGAFPLVVGLGERVVTRGYPGGPEERVLEFYIA